MKNLFEYVVNESGRDCRIYQCKSNIGAGNLCLRRKVKTNDTVETIRMLYTGETFGTDDITAVMLKQRLSNYQTVTVDMKSIMERVMKEK